MAVLKIVRNSKGVIFITTMVISMLMILIGVSASNMLLQDVHMIRRLKYSTQAKYLAEAGVSEALVDLYNASTSGWSSGATFSGSLSAVNGTYSGVISKVGTRWLISSTGTVQGVSKTVTVEVKNLYPEALLYALVSGEDIIMKANQGNIIIKGDIHANDDMSLEEIGNPTLLNVQALAPATGKATSCNSYDASKGNVVIADEANSGGGKDPIEMLSFDFGSFKSVAQSGGGNFVSAVSGEKTYTNATITGGTAGLTYVDDDVKFIGTCAITGGFVAKGDITLNQKDGSVVNNLTQDLDSGSQYPIFMSQEGSRIKLYGVFNADPAVASLIYATNDIDIQTPSGSPTVLGTVIAGGELKTTANASITLQYSQITAGSVVSVGVEVISWNQ